MIDVSLIKNLRINLKKTFDKGEVHKVYQKMYNEAERIAKIETSKYRIKIIDRYTRGKDISNRMILDYHNGRIEFHMKRMNRLLELYAISKKK